MTREEAADSARASRHVAGDGKGIDMPVVSKAQNAAMHSAAEGESTLGIPASVGKEFVQASHGMKMARLPQHVGGEKRKAVAKAMMGKS